VKVRTGGEHQASPEALSNLVHSSEHLEIRQIDVTLSGINLNLEIRGHPMKRVNQPHNMALQWATNWKVAEPI
jgi:hypothetical protein